MKETTKLKLVMTIMLATLTLECSAQTENPRGIYKMMTIIGKAGEVKAPFDQYKICTDEVTLTLSMKQAGYFILHDNDKGKIFNCPRMRTTRASRSSTATHIISP